MAVHKDVVCMERTRVRKFLFIFHFFFFFLFFLKIIDENPQESVCYRVLTFLKDK